MESGDTKIVLNEIKANIGRFSGIFLKLIPYLAVSSLFTTVMFSTIYHLVVKVYIGENVINLFTFDIYSFVEVLETTLSQPNLAVLAYMSIILSICFLALNSVYVYRYHDLRKNFRSLHDVDVALTDSKYMNLGVIVYMIFMTVSIFLPGILWIISISLANISLPIVFFFYAKILNKFGYKLGVKQNSFTYFCIGGIFHIIAVCLFYFDPSFLFLSLPGYLFQYLGFKKFQKQINYIAPVVKEAPPPPTIAAPATPAPKPIIGTNGSVTVVKVPSPEEIES